MNLRVKRSIFLSVAVLGFTVGQGYSMRKARVQKRMPKSPAMTS